MFVLKKKQYWVFVLQISLLSSLVFAGIYLGYLSWVYNGDTLIFFLQSKLLLSGDGIGYPRTVAATYFFPDLILFNLFWAAGIREVIATFLIYISFQVIAFYFVAFLLLRPFYSNFVASNLATLVTLIVMLLGYTGLRNWSVLFTPGIHVSALWLSVYLLYYCVYSSRNWFVHSLVILATLIASISDRFIFILFSIPITLSICVNHVLYKNTKILQHSLIIILVLTSAVAIAVTPLLELTDIKRNVSFSNPMDYAHRIKIIWREVFSVKFYNAPIVTAFNLIVSFFGIWFVLFKRKLKVLDHKQYIFLYVVIISIWAPIAFMLFLNTKIENRYSFSFELLSPCLFLMLIPDIIFGIRKVKFWIMVGLSSLVFISFSGPSIYSAFLGGGYGEPKPKVARCVQNFLHEFPEIHKIGSGPYFESRIAEAFFHDQIDMMAVMVDGEIGWIRHPEKYNDKTASFFIVDRNRKASAQYGPEFLAKKIRAAKFYECDSVLIAYDLYGKNILQSKINTKN